MSNGQDILDFTDDFAGRYPNNATTPTGNVLLTTSGQTAGSSYTISIEAIKGV